MTKVNITVQAMANFWVNVFCVGIIIFVSTQVSSFLEHPVLYTIFLLMSFATLTAKEIVIIDLAKGEIAEGTGFWE